ncbi:MAG: tetratricopeptide repeat protein [Deltaproteobacteria bacterium]|nr:tetratricopeptide repeat protein [Deltaproteobacteria bacterium]
MNARLGMINGQSIIFSLALCALLSATLVSACASFQAAGAVQAGRQDLIIGRSESALAHFQRAAHVAPDYTADFTPLRESVWTYIGRAYYASGKLSEARQALEQARSRNEHDYLARLYLGLTLARDGRRENGLREIQTGLGGLQGWLEFINYNTWYGQFWDPDRTIQREIQSNLAMISGREIDWQKLIAGGEWIGQKMEEEIDLARRDEVKERTMEGEGRKD